MDPTENVWPDFQEDYRFVMSGAHRKPAYEIGAPSITRHIGFWFPARSDDETREVATGLSKGTNGKLVEGDTKQKETKAKLERYKEWISDIEDLILDIYNRLSVLAEGKWKPPIISNLQPSTIIPSGQIELLEHRIHRPIKGGPYEFVCHNGKKADPLRARRNQSVNEGEYAETPKTWYETVHIDATWESMPLDIRIEVTDEYFTISTTIDFSRMKVQPRNRRGRKVGQFDTCVDDAVGDCEEAKTSNLYKRARCHFYRIIEIANRRRMAVDARCMEVLGKDNDTRLLEPHSEFLFKTIWEDLSRQILDEISPSGYIQRIGQRFVDLRNISLQCVESGNSGSFFSGVVDSLTTRRQKVFIVCPWRKVNGGFVDEPDVFMRKHSLRDTVVGHIFDKDDLEWVNAIHPILLAAEPREANCDPNGSDFLASDPVEYTFTKFFRERCIYGSGFGPQVERNETRGEPLSYVTLFGYDEPRQQGRLIYLLQTLASYRIAALHGLQTMKFDYEKKLDEVEKCLNDAGMKLVENPPPKTIVELDSARKELDNMTDFASPSTAKGLKAEKGIRAHSYDWMSLRAWRLTYYRDRFERLAKALAAKNIEGFQAYEDFIEHRLGRAYYTVRLVADRFAELRAREIALRAHWERIKGNEREEEIEVIQKVGEWLAFFVLVPYYASHIILLWLWYELASVHDAKGADDHHLLIIHRTVIAIVYTLSTGFFFGYRSRRKGKKLKVSLVEATGR